MGQGLEDDFVVADPAVDSREFSPGSVAHLQAIAERLETAIARNAELWACENNWAEWARAYIRRLEINAQWVREKLTTLRDIVDGRAEKGWPLDAQRVSATLLALERSLDPQFNPLVRADEPIETGGGAAHEHR